MEAAGDLSLIILDRRHEPVPNNVARLAHPGWPDESLPDRTPELLLAALIYEQLGVQKKRTVQCVARRLAFEGDRAAARASNFLRLISTDRRLP